MEMCTIFVENHWVLEEAPKNGRTHHLPRTAEIVSLVFLYDHSMFSPTDITTSLSLIACQKKKLYVRHFFTVAIFCRAFRSYLIQKYVDWRVAKKMVDILSYVVHGDLMSEPGRDRQLNAIEPHMDSQSLMMSCTKTASEH